MKVPPLGAGDISAPRRGLSTVRSMANSVRQLQSPTPGRRFVTGGPSRVQSPVFFSILTPACVV
jgi:hypothetical protein